MTHRHGAPAFLVLVAAAAAGAQPTFRGLGIPNGYSNLEANGVSADGLFVVGSATKGGTTFAAFRWSAAGYTWLGDLQGGIDRSWGYAVSAHGFHLAGRSVSASGEEGFRWQGGSMTGVGDLPGGGFYSTISGISADGSVVAGLSTGDFGGQSKSRAVYSIRGGPLQDLGSLKLNGTSFGASISADGSVIAGESDSAQGLQVMRWTRLEGMVGLGDLPGGQTYSAGGFVSADGSVVVGYSESTNGSEAFRWTKAGGMVGMGDLPGGSFGSEARGVSADGSVIVGYAESAAQEAFIWTAKDGMRSLRDVLIGMGTQGLAGWTLKSATGISGDGLTIVGNGTNPGGKSEPWIAYLGPDPLTPQDTDLVSLSATEQLGNNGSTYGSVSNDGTVVAFHSTASNLVANDTNARADVFIRNRPSEWTTRVSVSTAGTQGNGDSFNARISGNGRFVVFASDATNLVAGDTNGRRDIFIHDRTAKTTERLSVSTAGVQANGDSDMPQVSPDGRFVVFQSDATNLVAGDTNNTTDIFLRDRQSGTTTRMSVSSAGLQANGRSYQPHLADNGLSIVFASDATNLFMADNNNATDIFLRNRQNNQTVIISAGSGEAQIGNGNSTGPRISGNGRYITYTSSATNLVVGDTNGATDVFVRDRFNATTTRISMAPNQGNADSAAIAISANGRYILYNSSASNLVKNDTNGVRDVFLHDGWTFLTRRVSVGIMGGQASAACSGTAISADGRFILFNTLDGGMVPFDTNGKSDVFLATMPR